MLKRSVLHCVYTVLDYTIVIAERIIKTIFLANSARIHTIISTVQYTTCFNDIKYCCITIK